MGLRGRIKMLTQQAEEDAVLIRLRGGSTRVFTVMDVQKEMFLAKCDLVREEARGSPVLEGLYARPRQSRGPPLKRSTGPSRPRFSWSPPTKRGGWVEVYRLEEDGTVTKVRHEGGTLEAERLREEARNQGPAF
jgi:hypothetical protein